MLQIEFSRDIAETLLRSIDQGKPLSPKGEKWTLDELFMAAGAVLWWLRANHPKLDVSQPVERLEAIFAAHEAEVHGAVEQCSDLAGLVQKQQFDSIYHPTCKIAVRPNKNGSDSTVFEGLRDPRMKPGFDPEEE